MVDSTRHTLQLFLCWAESSLGLFETFEQKYLGKIVRQKKVKVYNYDMGSKILQECKHVKMKIHYIYDMSA